MDKFKFKKCPNEYITYNNMFINNNIIENFSLGLNVSNISRNRDNKFTYSTTKFVKKNNRDYNK